MATPATVGLPDYHNAAGFDDRVRVTIAAANAQFIGTGDFQTFTTDAGYRTFSDSFEIGQPFYYVAEGDGTGKWELGIAVLTGPFYIVRGQTIRSSEPGNALVDFTDNADLKIYSTLPSTHIRRSLPGRMLAMARGLAMP